MHLFPEGEYLFVCLSACLCPFISRVLGVVCLSLPSCSVSRKAVTVPLPLTSDPACLRNKPLLLTPPQSPASSSHSVFLLRSSYSFHSYPMEPWLYPQLPSSLPPRSGGFTHEHLMPCPKEGGSPLGLVSPLVASLSCVQLPPSHCFSSFDVLLTICSSSTLSRTLLPPTGNVCTQLISQKNIAMCLINCNLKLTSPPLLRK